MEEVKKKKVSVLHGQTVGGIWETRNTNLRSATQTSSDSKNQTAPPHEKCVATLSGVNVSFFACSAEAART